MSQYILAAYLALFILSNCKLLQRREDYIKLSAKKSTNNLYYTQLYFGNPPQLQKLIIDSGSSYPVIRHNQCSRCQSEGLSQTSFNPQQSSTYQPLNCKKAIQPQCYQYCLYSGNPCHFQIIYGMDSLQSSLSGVIGSDQVRFQLPNSKGEERTKEVFVPNFGLFIQQSRILEKLTNGILGINRYQSWSILFKWFSLNHIQQSSRKIGLCLSGNIGYLQFGNIEQQQTKSIKLKHIYNPSGQFAFKVNTLKVNDFETTPRQGFIIDSGSQIMIFPLEFYNQVVEIAKDACFLHFVTCSQMDMSEPIINVMDNNIDYQAKCYQINNFNVFDIDQYLNYNYPPIQFKIGGSTFKIMPSEYMQKIQGSVFYSYVCLRIKPSIEQMYLLGVRWMKGKKFIFHLKQEVIQIFQEYSCVSYYEEIQSQIEAITIPQLIAIVIIIVLLIWYCLRKKKSAKHQQIELSSQ